MPTLTSLPLPVLTHILRYLCAEHEQNQRYRSTLRETNTFIPTREPDIIISLEGAETAHSVLPNVLLAPALASPILATASQRVLSVTLSYLTDINTEIRLPLWITAFARYVKAVSIQGIDLQAAHDLSNQGMRNMIRNSCHHAVELLKALSIDDVRLQVLDLVHLPFYTTHEIKDTLLSGLCAALESSHASLTQLALPVYPNSDICAIALESVTLPHLTVFSMEFRNLHCPDTVLTEELNDDSPHFLRMMQAVDGHANRSSRLTTVKELRFIHMQGQPCTEATPSGCSEGFFEVIRTLRIRTNISHSRPSFYSFAFISLFHKLESLYWDRIPNMRNIFSMFLLYGLKQVHLCHPNWIIGRHVGADRYEVYRHQRRPMRDCVMLFRESLTTLGSSYTMNPRDVVLLAKSCPNLEYLSLYVTPSNISRLRNMIEKCERLTGLEMLLDENMYGRLGKLGWQELGKAIPFSHPKLCEIAIQTTTASHLAQAPVDAVIDCFVEVIKRSGARVQRLVFEISLKTKLLVRLGCALIRIIETCTEYSRLLRCLYLEISPCRYKKGLDDPRSLLEMHMRLRKSRDTMVDSLPYLNKVNLGFLHFCSEEFLDDSYYSETC